MNFTIVKEEFFFKSNFYFRRFKGLNNVFYSFNFHVQIFIQLLIFARNSREDEV